MQICKQGCLAIKAITLQDILGAVFLLSHQDVVREAMGVNHAVVVARDMVMEGTGMVMEGTVMVMEDTVMGTEDMGMDMIMDVIMGMDMGMEDTGTEDTSTDAEDMGMGTVMEDMVMVTVMARYALFLNVNRHKCIIV